MKAPRSVVVVSVLGLGWLSFGAPAGAAPNVPEPSRAVAQEKECGVGVCKRKVPAVAVCTPGRPITANEGWLSAPDDKTGSWDANCDGTVEKQPLPEHAFWVGCESETPGPSGCVQKKLVDPECGKGWVRSGECKPTSDGKCKAITTMAPVRQRCR